MDLKATAKQIEAFVRSNSPEIMSGLAVSGVVTTAYLAHEVGYGAGQESVLNAQSDRSTRRRDILRSCWKHYIPTIAVGVGTVGLIVLASRSAHRRTAAMTAAYSISERAFSEYKDKVKEKIGENKEQKIRDEVVQARVQENAPGPQVVFVGGGNVICYEYFTGRYFLSDMETLKKAENEINARVLRCDYATLAEFQTLIKQPHTQGADDMGWHHAGGLLELEFTSCLMDESRPALSFTYTNLKPL